MAHGTDNRLPHTHGGHSRIGDCGDGRTSNIPRGEARIKTLHAKRAHGDGDVGDIGRAPGGGSAGSFRRAMRRATADDGATTVAQLPAVVT